MTSKGYVRGIGFAAQAALFALLLVSFLPAVAHASSLSLTCSFSNTTASNCPDGAQQGALFDYKTEFGAGFVAELRFDDILRDFSVTMNAVNVDFATMQSRLEQFPGEVGVPIDPGNPDGAYIDFQIVTPPIPNEDFASAGGRANAATQGYDLYIYWQAATDAEFHDVQIAHETGSTGGDFDTNITIPNSYTTEPPSCVFEGGCNFSLALALGPSLDPGVGGRDNMFTGFTLMATDVSVPEPATMLLVTTGVGVLYRRRQRRTQDPRA